MRAFGVQVILRSALYIWYVVPLLVNSGMAQTADVGQTHSYWNARGRWLVFLLAASSIACLLFDFYRLCPMRLFTIFIFLPALAALFAFALFDGHRGDRQLWHAVMIGLIGGLLAAIAYDVFRLPFVFAKE